MDGSADYEPWDRAALERERRVRANAADELRSLTARMNKFLADDDYRPLMAFAELKVLGAATDVMSDIAGRLSR